MTSPIITEAVRTLIERRDLSRIEAAAAMEAIMSGAATNAQIAAFLTALRMKGETVEELIGFAQVMRAKAVRVRTRADEVAGLTGTDRDMLIDTSGTGGDAAGTFNVSTATAVVVAGAGLRDAKHGHRALSPPPASAHAVATLRRHPRAPRPQGRRPRRRCARGRRRHVQRAARGLRDAARRDRRSEGRRSGAERRDHPRDPRRRARAQARHRPDERLGRARRGGPGARPEGRRRAGGALDRHGGRARPARAPRRLLPRARAGGRLLTHVTHGSAWAGGLALCRLAALE